MMDWMSRAQFSVLDMVLTGGIAGSKSGCIPDSA
jgi:hypothetical protein